MGIIGNNLLRLIIENVKIYSSCFYQIMCVFVLLRNCTVTFNKFYIKDLKRCLCYVDVQN